MIHKITTHPQQPSVVVAECNNAHLVAVGQGWLASAFEVAVGSSLREALGRFSDELRAVLDANESTKLSDEELVELVRRIQMRMCVAAEWAERLEDLEKERGAAQ